jgi:acetyltransferase-like isoleucine patch superfamily enzyme
MRINGTPNYLSARIWFDGTDYSAIELNEGCTISSSVYVLTHDWAIATIVRELGIELDKPVGITRPVRIGRNAFVGAGVIILPGSDIGNGALVGAGSVVRGNVEPFSIVTGNPARRVGDVREYVPRKLRDLGVVAA